jgi:hypothetical protein
LSNIAERKGSETAGTHKGVVAQELIEGPEPGSTELCIADFSNDVKERTPLRRISVLTIDVQSVLRHKGGGVRIVGETFDATHLCVALQSIREIVEVDQISGLLVDHQGFVALVPSIVVLLHSAEN